MVETIMKKREEEITALPGKLAGVKIVRVAEAATKTAQENAFKAAQQISDYFEKAGAKNMAGMKNSELGQILFG